MMAVRSDRFGSLTGQRRWTSRTASPFGALILLCCTVFHSPARSAESPNKVFHYSTLISMQWFEASRECWFKDGFHEYFLIQLNDETDHNYRNVPLNVVVRSVDDLSSLFMAKRCSDKPAWFIYDFNENRYLADDLRYKEAQTKWLSLGNEHPRMVKARRPEKHLQMLYTSRRLPTKAEFSKLGTMLFAPLTAMLVFLSLLSAVLYIRHRAAPTANAVRWYSLPLVSALTVGLILLSLIAYASFMH